MSDRVQTPFPPSRSTHPPPLDSTLRLRPISIFSIFHSPFFFILPAPVTTLHSGTSVSFFPSLSPYQFHFSYTVQSLIKPAE